jgi:hypothetical protein
VLLAAYPALRQVGSYPAQPLDLQILTPKEVAIFRRLGDFLIPPGTELPGSGGDDETIRRIDRLLAGAPDEKRRLLRALPLVFEHGTALDTYGARRLTALPSELGDRFLAEWASSDDPLKSQLWVAAKTAFGFSYFERPDVLAAMGWAVACTGRV